MNSADLKTELLSKAFQFRQALSDETDRGVALYASAYLDSALSDLLYCSLVTSKQIEKDLFKGTAPLASFSSRISMSFYLGKISNNERRELDLLRKIRNHFAHSAQSISFATPDIANRCSELMFSYHDDRSIPRKNFIASSFGLLARIHSETYKANAPDENRRKVPTTDLKLDTRESISELYQQFDTDPSQ